LAILAISLIDIEHKILHGQWGEMTVCSLCNKFNFIFSTTYIGIKVCMQTSFWIKPTVVPLVVTVVMPKDPPQAMAVAVLDPLWTAQTMAIAPTFAVGVPKDLLQVVHFATAVTPRTADCQIISIVLFHPGEVVDQVFVTIFQVVDYFIIVDCRHIAFCVGVRRENKWQRMEEQEDLW
jgi:hypothetical protein